MPGFLSPKRLIGTGLVLLAIAVVALILIPSNMYILLPDPAHPVSALVKVPAGKGKPDRNGGGIYFVDVFERKATLIERIFPGLRDGSTLVDEQAIVSCGSSPAQQRKADLQAMTRSQQIAAVVALRALGYKVKAGATGALIDFVGCDGPAVGKLQGGDVIVGVDGKPVKTTAQLHERLQTHRPGDVVRLSVRANGGTRDIRVKMVADPKDKKRALVGIIVEQAFQATLPFPVRIDARNVGGPSAGLAFVLDLMQKLGRDVDHGYKVAATGTINPDGSVGAIGGVKQKTFGARAAHVDVFLVPAGDNAREARRYAKGLRIIPVESYRQALRALATLPPKT